MSNDLSFSVHIANTVTAASKLVGWGLRTFCGRGRRVMLTLLKSLVQPKLDYFSQLWSPSDQASIGSSEAHGEQDRGLQAGQPGLLGETTGVKTVLTGTQTGEVYGDFPVED